MTSKYPAWMCTLVMIGAACTAAAPPSRSPTTSAPAADPVTAPTPNPTPASAVPVISMTLDRSWYTVPDGLFRDAAVATVDFARDPAGMAPRVRLDPSTREFTLTATQEPGRWTAQLDLGGMAPGVYTLLTIERINGADLVAPEKGLPRPLLHLSPPEYVVWTVDFEGDAAGDAEMANTAAIADGLAVPMTVMWNPRAWTTSQVSRERADAMLAWTKGRAAKGDEVALHVHMWNDFVAAAGVAPRLGPRWAGRTDGYDVPMTAYTEDDQRAIIAYGLRLMADHGLAGVTSFRAGGLFADATTLRAAVANGMTADCSATAAGTFGSLRLPWTLSADAQPYVPARDDANKAGDLAILEAPTNGGNTYGYTVASIAPIVSADLAMLAKRGEVATARKAITIVSHPGTIDEVERPAIETLLRAFEPLRYDKDSGPLRFVTLRQLATAYGR